MFNEKQLRIKAGIAVNDVLAAINLQHKGDIEYFGHMSEFVANLLTLGLMIRFKTQQDFHDMLKAFVEGTGEEEQIRAMWETARAAMSGGSSIKSSGGAE